MITLYKARLKALAEDPATQKYLESKYDWYQDMHISYANRLRLERGDKDPQFKCDWLIKECREKAVNVVLGYLEAWAEDCSFVEGNAPTEVALLDALLKCIYTGEDPTTGHRPAYAPVVRLYKYPKCVHDRGPEAAPHYSAAMQQALRSYNWVTPDRLAELLDDSGREWTYIERNMLSHVLQDPNATRAFTSNNKNTWQDSYESFMPALIECVRFPQLAQKVVDVMGTLGITEDEAEAVLAMNMVIKLLHEFYGHIKKDLRHYSEKYADYMAYSEFVGGLVEDKAELLGRLTAWNHRIISGTESAFLIIDTWEPGKDPKSAYRYYLVKE